MSVLMMFFRGLVTFTAGIGLTSLVDKFFPDKLPAGTAPIYPIKQADGKINWMRVIFFVFLGAIATLLVKFIGKKLNIKLLK